MKSTTSYLFLVIGMGVVTYIPRMLPATILSKKNIPETLVVFLQYVPVAVLSALLFPGIMMIDDKLCLLPSNSLLIATLLTFPIAYWKKSMFLTVLVGMGIVIFLNNF